MNTGEEKFAQTEPLNEDRDNSYYITIYAITSIVVFLCFLITDYAI